MGYIRIITDGSFPTIERTFMASKHGHAHAVAEAIAWLSGETLTSSINLDHSLHDQKMFPSESFTRNTKKEEK